MNSFESSFESPLESKDSSSTVVVLKNHDVSGKSARAIAHDLRSPLSALKMIMPLLKTLPEDQYDLIFQATAQIESIANRIEEL